MGTPRGKSPLSGPPTNRAVTAVHRLEKSQPGPGLRRDHKREEGARSRSACIPPETGCSLPAEQPWLLPDRFSMTESSSLGGTETLLSHLCSHRPTRLSGATEPVSRDFTPRSRTPCPWTGVRGEGTAVLWEGAWRALSQGGPYQHSHVCTHRHKDVPRAGPRADTQVGVQRSPRPWTHRGWPTVPGQTFSEPLGGWEGLGALIHGPGAQRHWLAVAHSHRG